MKNTTRLATVAAILAAQFIAAGWLIFRYERIVSRGTECRFLCRGYDPYDPFRGRYVRLSVRADCDPLPDAEPDTLPGEGWCRIDPTGGTNSLSRIVETAYEPSGEGIWVRRPNSSFNRENIIQWDDRKEDESWDDFEKRREAGGYRYYVNLPDQFFMNEKLAPKADKAIRKNDVTPVAVYRVKDGEMVLVEVEVDGKPLAEHLSEVE